MRNLLVAQSGGPTAAINATVAGVVSCAVLSGKVDHIYGAVNGIEGVLAEKFLDLGKKLDSAEKISLLMQTPAAALGSCRYKLPEDLTDRAGAFVSLHKGSMLRGCIGTFLPIEM